jgi:hypothetical protein
MLEERDGLLMPMPLLAQPGHLPGRDLQRGEQDGGAVPDVVVGALPSMAGLHGQHLLGAVQRLNLNFSSAHSTIAFSTRRQIQADHVGDLRDQLGVGGELEGVAFDGLTR